VEPSDADVPPANKTDEGLRRKLSNFLSAWMPGASVSMGRARGAEIVREERTRTIEQEAQPNDVDEAEGSTHVSLFTSRSQAGNRCTPSADLSRSKLRTNRNAIKHRSPLPADFIVSGGAVRPDASDLLPAFSHPEIIATSRDIPGLNSIHADTPPRLRHAATSPNLKRPSLPSKRSLTTHHATTADSSETEAVRGRTLTVRDENAATSSLTVPGRPRKRKSGSRSRPRPINPTRHTTFTPASAVAPVLKTDEVVCRSTPHSRSASRVRGSKRHSMDEDIPPVPPLLSPAIVEDRLNAWLQNGGRVQRPRSHASQFSTLDDADGHDNDDDDPGLEHIVSSHLSGSVGSGSVSHSSSESVRPKERATAFPVASIKAFPAHSTFSHLEVTGSDTIRRQRSIQSLRAHLAPRHQRPHFLSNSTYIGRTGVLLSGRVSPSPRPGQASGWLDGPEWRGAMHQPTRTKPQRAGKRGLIPWFGGERAFLEHGARDPSFDQDE
jgi:hypothetical protein